MARANGIRQTINLNQREVHIMTHEQLTVSVAIASWKTAVARTDKVFSELTEEQFLKEELCAFDVRLGHVASRTCHGPEPPFLSIKYREAISRGHVHNDGLSVW
jgi:hypothetical protein